ncbi:MAG: hypothetical protein IJ662_00645 [Clostridia bacterium]|nr:hypothetical protein [Clostridia bacterium]
MGELGGVAVGQGDLGQLAADERVVTNGFAPFRRGEGSRFANGEIDELGFFALH